MSTTRLWAAFHSQIPKHNVNAPTAHPSRDPMSWFSDKRTTPQGAHVEEIPNADDPMSDTRSMEDLLGALTKAEVSGYQTIVGVPASTPSLPPTSFPINPSLRSLQSMRSRNTLRPPTAYTQQDCGRFELIKDEDDDRTTIVGDQFDDEVMSERYEGSEPDIMSICSIPGSVGG